MIINTARQYKDSSIYIYMLSREEKQRIINRLPKNTELSYDVILHKKVYADLFLIQPKGLRSFLWFTYTGGKNVCAILELSKNGNVRDLEIYPACFDASLTSSTGTLLIGTHFLHKTAHYFSTEDVVIYKGATVVSNSFHDKIGIIKEMFERHIAQKSYTSSFVTLGMPCWCPNYASALETKDTLPYPVYGIKAFNTRNRKNPLCGIYQTREKQKVEGIFRVKASLEADIYKLYCYDRDNPTAYSTAAVPSYRRSVALNDIFRCVKENASLDLLEESDDEEEFENTHEDKFVNMKKSIAMRCIYHKKFRKWEPVEAITIANPKLITRQNAILLEKKV